MKTQFFGFSVAFAVALFGVGCSSGNGGNTERGDDRSELTDPEGEADGISRPVGSYGLTSDAHLVAAFSRIVLKTDKTIHFNDKDLEIVCLPDGPCMNTACDGTYKFTKSTTSSRR